jgi:hypothetical protein
MMKKWSAGTGGRWALGVLGLWVGTSGSAEAGLLEARSPSTPPASSGAQTHTSAGAAAGLPAFAALSTGGPRSGAIGANTSYAGGPPRSSFADLSTPPRASNEPAWIVAQVTTPPLRDAALPPPGSVAGGQQAAAPPSKTGASSPAGGGAPTGGTGGASAPGGTNAGPTQTAMAVLDELTSLPDQGGAPTVPEAPALKLVASFVAPDPSQLLSADTLVQTEGGIVGPALADPATSRLLAVPAPSSLALMFGPLAAFWLRRRKTSR